MVSVTVVFADTLTEMDDMLWELENMAETVNLSVQAIDLDFVYIVGIAALHSVVFVID